ncbi:MAG TPA: SpoIIE family protein phosphatase [Yinghuangia sp.]|uniref:ATP-binding SpoIIE family protein phosphatase n=1 Tax=Yinghuangia sp. YIM S10712 TaxID=3436930 RepID=UPI002C1251AD|nr:SpoIIE family protein phosphatase [Yinghuangia sp.]
MNSSDRAGSEEVPFLICGIEAGGIEAAAVVLHARGGIHLWTPAARRLFRETDGERIAENLRRALAVGHRDDGGAHRGNAVLPSASGVPTEFRYTAHPLSRLTGPDQPGRPADGNWLVVLVPSRRAVAWEAARERSERYARLSHAAATGIGATLDLVDTTNRLARVLVPELTDLAAVDLTEPVLHGEEPPKGDTDIRIRRVAMAAADANGGVTGQEGWPDEVVGLGHLLPWVPESPLLHPVVEGAAVVVSDMEQLREALSMTPQESRAIIPRGAHSLIVIPLFARGLILGTVTAWRVQTEADFDDADAGMLAEITSRAALSVDNARRYTREHRTAVALQRSLLPRPVLRTPAADTAGTYLPAEGDAGVGGDWFDVIALSSLRTGFVVGDVVGHGLGATAAMGRLRTAVQTLADLDLEPVELISHLDDLVLSYWPEHDPGDPTSELAAQGATFLYGVYDPVGRRCAIASAGHPPPLVALPGREPEFVDLSPGPPLGVGGMPFESVELDLPDGTLLAFFTDGLIERRDADISTLLGEFRRSIDRNRDRPLIDIGPEVLGTLDPSREDDVALLLARTRSVPEDAIADWELPADPSVVSRARELATRQLSAWGLDELVFSTELVVSELVTNAIRYAGGPIGLRLIRDNILVCEVSDPSNTQPRLRRSVATDEGGRGLFLVAQLASRWGSRYRRTGKTIWTEQGIETMHALGASGGESGEEALLNAFDVEW